MNRVINTGHEIRAQNLGEQEIIYFLKFVNNYDNRTVLYGMSFMKNDDFDNDFKEEMKLSNQPYTEYDSDENSNNK
ncbi:hypothetical protein BpHYR1_051278 [Brachionus plicatilis]|uniref:Uncharacterized protein n=1 Tax=Brachionus plicatilis TaxID=10195 RepID=A0A3M7T8J4_BRAPC|nr:hypothetical protein BpHYR1_051278 [Brachionus plicatilis]